MLSLAGFTRKPEKRVLADFYTKRMLTWSRRRIHEGKGHHERAETERNLYYAKN